MTRQAFVLIQVGVLAAGLSACGQGADTGATRNPNAPGSPGTGNPPVQATPQQPDARAGGSSGGVGIVPPPGSSGGDVMPGTTGRGASAPGLQAPGSASANRPSSTPESTASTAPVAPQGSTHRSQQY